MVPLTAEMILVTTCPPTPLVVTTSRPQSAGGTMAAWGGIDVAEHADTGNTRPEEEVE